MNREWKIAECFNVDYYPDLGKQFPRFQNRWNGKLERSSFRVTGFYRIYEKPVRPKSDDVMVNLQREMFSKIIADIHNQRTEMDKMKHLFSVVLEQCAFEDAEFIYGQSVSYPIVPIEWCEYIGDVKWEADYIEQNRQDYVDRLEHENVSGDVHRHRKTHPRYEDAVSQLVQGGLEGGNRIEDDEYHYYDQWCQKYGNVAYFEVLNGEDEE